MALDHKKLILPYLLCLLGFSGAAIAFYPGYLSPDSVLQLSQAYSLWFSNWHPPIMALLWHGLLVLFPRAAPAWPMLLLQLSMLWLSLLVLTYCVATRTRKFLWLIPLIGFFPSVLVDNNVLWKDIQMGNSLLLVYALIFLLQGLRQQVVKALLLIFILIFDFYAFSLRHEAIFACLPSFYLLIVFYFPTLKPKLKIVAVLLLALIFTLVRTGLEAAIHTHNLYPAQQVMYYDLASLSIATDQMLIPYDDCVTPDTCFRVIKARYDRDLIDPLMNGIPLNKFNNKAQYQELERAWFTAIFTHPFLYMQERLLFFKDLLVYRPIFYPYVAPNLFNLQNPRLSVTKFFLFGVDPFAEGFIVLFWVLLNLGSFILLRVNQKVFNVDPFYRLWCKSLLGAGLLLWLSHLIVAAAPDFRYVYWTMLSTLTGFVAIVLKLGLFEKDSFHD